MDREALHELIEKGQLEEALGLLLGQYQGGKLEKEVRLLQARYREARTQRDQGVVSWEQFNLEQNRLIKAMLYPASKSQSITTAKPRSTMVATS